MTKLVLNDLSFKFRTQSNQGGSGPVDICDIEVVEEVISLEETDEVNGQDEGELDPEDELPSGLIPQENVEKNSSDQEQPKEYPCLVCGKKPVFYQKLAKACKFLPPNPSQMQHLW